ncbi:MULTISPECIES: S8 family serine peptidase [unclassified Polynucleobacter]|uniref:S8 family serine peptidase n=1 Tax=unclassified Polynucleobacter TaxID=2640945 RepID=UPI00137294A5|nr:MULTISPECIES: S8 family serine peptidase [unclassified Polynucleobacter]
MQRFLLAILLFAAPCVHAQVSLPWYFDDPKTNAQEAAAINAEQLVRFRGVGEVVVALIDSGLRSDHPSLRGKVLPGVDMVSSERNPRGDRGDNFAPDNEKDLCPITKRVNNPDVFSHGTGVASVIAGNGELGVFGVNSRVKILPIKIMGACPANRRDLMDGLRWAAGIHIDGVKDNLYPAKIINISMAGGESRCDPSLQELIDQLIKKNIIVISASGNTFGKSALEPSICDGVIGVGAVNPDNSNTFYTAVDSRILLYAPGGGSQSSTYSMALKNKIKVAGYDPNTGRPIARESGLGTSYSSALVAGVIAELVLQNLNLSAKSAISIIKRLNTMEDGSGRRNLNYERLLTLLRGEAKLQEEY